jgi:hypothetical protein
LSRKLTLITLVGLLAVFCATASATDILYTTLGPNGEYDTANGYFVDGSNYFNQVLAMPFTPNKTENMVDAVMALGNYQGGNSPVNAYLESDNGGQPGSILATLTQQGTIQPFSGGGSLIQFNCNGCGTVTQGTQYWLVAQEQDPATEQVWMFAYQDQTGNAAFNQLGSATGPWNLFDSTITGFRIDGSGVPEPGTLVMLGSGVLAAAGVIRRKFHV